MDEDEDEVGRLGGATLGEVDFSTAKPSFIDTWYILRCRTLVLFVDTESILISAEVMWLEKVA